MLWMKGIELDTMDGEDSRRRGEFGFEKCDFKITIHHLGKNEVEEDNEKDNGDESNTGTHWRGNLPKA